MFVAHGSEEPTGSDASAQLCSGVGMPHIDTGFKLLQFFLILGGYKISHTEVRGRLNSKGSIVHNNSQSLLKLYFICTVFIEVVKLSLFTTFICFISTSDFNHIFFFISFLPVNRIHSIFISKYFH